MSDEYYKAARYKSPKTRSNTRFKCKKGYYQHPAKSRVCVKKKMKREYASIH
jgi:hypothetical protein